MNIIFFLSYSYRIKMTRHDIFILHVTVLSKKDKNKNKMPVVIFPFLGGTWIFPKSLWRLVATPAPGPAAAVGEVASASVVVGWRAGAAGVTSPSAGHTPVPSTATVMVSAAATAASAVAATAAAATAAPVGSPSRG